MCGVEIDVSVAPPSSERKNDSLLMKITSGSVGWASMCV
jgi:hypothetical protein